MKVEAMSRLRRLGLVLILSGMLFAACADMARAACVCSPTCTECVSCPLQYEAVVACEACYKESPGKNSPSLSCSFIGTMARAPVQPPTPMVFPRSGAPRFPSFPQTLPGTRPDAMRLDRLAWPDSFIVKERSPASPGIGAGAASGWSSSLIAGILPGTRPNSTKPKTTATLWGTDALHSMIASNSQPLPVWWVLPGTRPDQSQPTFDYLQKFHRLEADTGVSWQDVSQPDDSAGDQQPK